MRESCFDTIVLRGEDSVRFLNSLIRPTENEIIENKQYFDKIERNIQVKKTRNGFESEIDDLDLSFLSNQEEVLEVESVVECRKDDTESSDNSEICLKVSIKKINNYNYLSDEILSVAA